MSSSVFTPLLRRVHCVPIRSIFAVVAPQRAAHPLRLRYPPRSRPLHSHFLHRCRPGLAHSANVPTAPDRSPGFLSVTLLPNMNLTTGASPDRILSLENIRGQLIRLEDTIIFLLIERAQFAHNKKIYEKGAFQDQIQWEGSWLEWFLFETESFHAKARRFTSPDEHPFTPREKLPNPAIAPQSFPPLLHGPSASHPSVNANDRILDFYVNHIVPGITEVAPGSPRLRTTGSSLSVDETAAALDDGNYGSAATRDVEVLQALSRRIHFGMFVSESKFRSAPWDFIPHILSNPPNTKALEALITKPEVEARLLVRLANKARVYGCEMDADGHIVATPTFNDAAGLRGKIDIDQVVALYRDYVIPLTKDVEVDYLVHRLDGVPQEQIDAWMAEGKK